MQFTDVRKSDSTVIEYSHGLVTDLYECYVTDPDPKQILRAKYGDDIVFGEWEPDGVNDEDERTERVLVWQTEGDAKRNSIQNAIAQILREEK